MSKNKYSTNQPDMLDPNQKGNTSGNDIYDSYQSIDPQLNPDEMRQLNAEQNNLVESIGQEYGSMMNELGGPNAGKNQKGNKKNRYNGR